MVKVASMGAATGMLLGLSAAQSGGSNGVTLLSSLAGSLTHITHSSDGGTGSGTYGPDTHPSPHPSFSPPSSPHPTYRPLPSPGITTPRPTEPPTAPGDGTGSPTEKPYSYPTPKPYPSSLPSQKPYPYPNPTEKPYTYPSPTPSERPSPTPAPQSTPTPAPLGVEPTFNPSVGASWTNYYSTVGTQAGSGTTIVYFHFQDDYNFYACAVAKNGSTLYLLKRVGGSYVGITYQNYTVAPGTSLTVKFGGKNGTIGCTVSSGNTVLANQGTQDTTFTSGRAGVSGPYTSFTTTAV